MPSDEPVWRVAVDLRWEKRLGRGAGCTLLAGSMPVGQVERTDAKGDQWMAYVISDDEGRHIDCYATEAEAKAALLDAAVKGLGGE